jgi:hypothetical protein
MTNPPPSWQLASSTGREAVTWVARSVDDSGPETALVCDVALAGRFYGAALEARPATAQPDFHLDIRGLAITVSTLERLHDHLTRWLSLPPLEQRKTALGLDCDLGSLFDQHVRLLLGERADTLSGGQPVATVRYVVGRMTGELWFAAEPDGLSSFSEQIRAGLRWASR